VFPSGFWQGSCRSLKIYTVCSQAEAGWPFLLSWPVGMGKRFQGVYNLFHGQLRIFLSREEKTPGQEGIVISDLSDPVLDELLREQADELREDIVLLEGAGIF